MDTPQLQIRVKELQDAVNPYTKGKKSTFSFSLSSLMANKSAIYLLVPAGIFLLLAIFRPSFLYTEVKVTSSTGLQQDGPKIDTTEKKFSFQKLLVYWLIFSSIFDLGLFGYFYNLEKKG